LTYRHPAYPAVFNRYLLFGAVEAGAARLDHEEAESMRREPNSSGHRPRRRRWLCG